MVQNPVVNPENLRTLFESAKPYSDLSSAFYSIKGSSLLGDKFLDAQSAKEVCEFAKAKADKNNLESIYYATSLAQLMPNCQLDTSVFKPTLDKGDASTTVADLYYYVNTAENLKMKIDSKKVAKSLTDALKADSSIVNQGFSLHIAAMLADSNKPFYDSIEDILDQADEVDGTSFQYEGGVGTTSIVLDGILTLSEKFNKLPAKFTNEKFGKFMNYIVSKRFPTNVKSAFFLLKGAMKFADNKFSVPVFLNRLSPIGQTNLVVIATNILGKSAGQVNLDAVSAVSSTGKASLFSGKKSFTAMSSDKTAFESKLIGAEKPAAGFYTVKIGLSGDKRFFMTKDSVEVKVTTKVTVSDVQLAVADRDTSQPKFVKFEGSVKKFEADQQSKFSVKFGVKDQNKGNLVEAHQAMLRFTEVASGREIIYLAETGSTKAYTVEIDFSTNGKNFRYQSGTYAVDLVVSDSLFENPTVLKLSQLQLKFSESADSAQASRSAMYSAKPEIKHLFRQPEKTPSMVISTVFASLCLAPLALVFILWTRIGFNFSRFEFSISGIIFHLSLLAIFGLFYCYWVKINMFTTVRYLGILGLVALVSGNQLLRQLASQKKTN